MSNLSNPMVFNLESEWSQDISAVAATIKTLASTDVAGDHALFFVKTTDMRRTFKFQVDSTQLDAAINGANGGTTTYEDVIFETSGAEWHNGQIDSGNTTVGKINLNAAHANMGPVAAGYEATEKLLNGASNTSVNPVSNATLSANPYSPDRLLLKHDFMRHLSLSLFNTPHFVDQFNNENQVMEDLTGKLAAEYENRIYTPINTAGRQEYNNLLSDYSNNIAQKLYEQLLHSNPERFVDSSGVDQTSPFFKEASINGNRTAKIAHMSVDGTTEILLDKQRPLPIVDGDSFEFVVTVDAAGDQTSISGIVGVNPPDRYVKTIKVVCVPDAGVDSYVSAVNAIKGSTPVTTDARLFDSQTNTAYDAAQLNVQPNDAKEDTVSNSATAGNVPSDYNSHAPYKGAGSGTNVAPTDEIV